MSQDIAIIGMAGRFPDARNLDELYVNLAKGKDSVREISGKRLESTTLPPEKEYRICGYLEEVDKFDHQLFNISPAEAQTMEPNQRLLLEVVYEIFENAAYSIDTFDGSNTCVYAAEAGNDYYKHAETILPTLITGNAREFLAARIARQFNLRGTAAMINTSCSSALAAVHFACNELILKDADYALVCAVNIDLFPFNDNSMNLGLLSPDGKSRAFSARANGMSRGEAATGVLLKPLDRAIKDKDIIHAVIKGSAVNNNARNSASLSAPDSSTQAEVIKKAWKKAGINPVDIGYIEAHGSGTELGDSLEIEGLDMAFKEYTDRKRFCPISTIKSNIGHGVFASGMSGLIEAVLSLKHRVIFPTIHFDTPNPLIDFEHSAVYVNETFKPWEVEEGKSRIAGVSSIGFSGTNCHLVLQEAPAAEAADTYNAYKKNKRTQAACPREKDCLIAVSSQNPQGLRENLETLLKKLEQGNSYRLDDIGYTLSLGRKHYDYRFACIARDLEGLKQQAAEVANQGADKNENRPVPGSLERLIFIFSDQEETKDNLLTFFLSEFPLFKKYFRQCSDFGGNLRGPYFRDFAFQYSFYRLLEDHGIITENILAVGIGKITAAVISGDITLEEAVNRVMSYKSETIANLEERVKSLIEKETGDLPTAFVDLGPGSIISRELENQDTGDHRFFVFRVTGNPDTGNPWLELLKSLYLANYVFDRKLFFKHLQGQKIELPPYRFQGVRCWLREKPAAITADLRSITFTSSPLYETGSEIQEKIAHAWREVLETEKFYLDDNFFEKGGDSLKATRVITQLNLIFMKELDFEDLFDFPTIRSLAKYIDGLLGTEQKIALIWKDVLKVPQVKAGDSFFALGGHSLLATQVLNRVKKEFQLELNFEDFFRHPTLDSLCQVIDNLIAEGKNRVRYQAVHLLEKKEHYPLSPAQKRFYLLQQKEKENTSFNGTRAMRLEGELQVERLEAAFEKLIRRHESLRTSFIIVNGEPRQRIHDDVQFEIERREAGEQEVSSLAADFIRLFDLATAPLMRVGLIKISDKTNQYILMVDIHHIISDGTSVSILVKDFMRFYRGENALALPVQYKDFSGWQIHAQETEILQQQENYWLNMFANDIPVLALNTDYPRSSLPVTSYEGDTLSFRVDAKTRKKLREIEKQTNTTLYMILLAAYNVLLMRYSSQEDIIVGTLTNGRTHAQLEGIIGVFVETLALRNKPARNKSFVDFLQEVKENSLNAFEYSAYPFEELLKKIQFKREINRNPLFDTMLLLQNYEHTGLEVEGLVCNPYPFKKNTLFFDVRLTAVEIGEEIEIEIDYARKLFKLATIQRLANHYLKLLQEIGVNDRIPLGELGILTEKEKHRILVEFNDTQTDTGKWKSVSRLFEEQVLKTPENTAVIYKNKEISYRWLNEQANGLARRMLAMGLQAGQPVGILLSPSPLMVAAVFAVWKAGGGYIPIDPKYPMRRITGILTDSAAKILLARQDLLPTGLDKTCNASMILPHLSDDEESWGMYDKKENTTNLEPGPSPDQPAYFIFTSGSTGTPKGAGVYHSGFANLIAWFVGEFGINAHDRNLLVTSMSFDLTQKNIYAPLVTGGTLTIPGLDYFNPGELLQIIADKQITWLNCTPGMVYRLVEFSDTGKLQQLTSLRYVFLGGEPISMNKLRKWIESRHFNAEIVNTYGPTECTDICAAYGVKHPGEFYNKSIPIGRPIYNVCLFVLDSSFQLVPPGVTGELCIGGYGIGIGYLNNPELTKEKFCLLCLRQPGGAFEKLPVTHPAPPQKFLLERFGGRFVSRSSGFGVYRTGDLVMWLPEGNIEFIGRRDHQVKIRGFRIELEEIENQLLGHEKINSAAVLALDRGDSSGTDTDGDKYLCAYYVSDEDLTGPGLREYLSTRLPGYMIPSYFSRLEKIPLTAHGKINKNSLPPPNTDTAELLGQIEQYVEPGTEEEIKMVKIWQELLGLDKIGIRDNFFQLGGDSLLVIQVITRIREEFQVELPVKIFFEMPFIKALLEEIKNQETGAVSIKPAPRDKEIPLSFAQERLWFLHRLDPDMMAYHVPRGIRLKGDADVALLEQTFSEIIRRHEILRTVFPDIDGKPVQHILPPFPFKIPVKNLSYLEEPRQSQKVREILLAEGQRPFDFEKGPMIRATLLKLKEDEHMLVLSEHHLVHDGWTQSVLLKEFLAIYMAYKEGKPCPLPELPIQYADFAYWQRSYMQGDVLEKHLDYWKKKLSGIMPVLNLPLDYPRPAQISGNGEAKRLRLSKRLSHNLEKFCRENEVTLFMTMLAAFNVLLYRYTGTEDLCVGTGIASRRYKEMEGMLGMVINTLSLRTHLPGDLSLDEALQRTKTTCLEAYEHEDTPFEKIVEAMQIERSLSYTPIFQVMYGFMDVPAEQLRLPGLELQVEEAHNRSAKFDINIIVVPYMDSPGQDEESPGPIVIQWEYNTDIFAGKTIDRMLRHYHRVLEKITTHPWEKISTLPLLDKTEEKQLLYEFNNSKVSFPTEKNLVDLFEEQLEKRPRQIAVSSRLNLTGIFTELDTGTNQVSLFNKLGGCCFKKNPYIFQYETSDFLKELDIPDREGVDQVALLKTQRHNYIAVNQAVLSLLDCFNGKTNLKSLYIAINQKNLTFETYTLDMERLTVEREAVTVNNRFEDIIALTKLLFRANLIDLADYCWEQVKVNFPARTRIKGNKKGKSNDSPAGKPAYMGTAPISKEKPGKVISPVLLLGDTTGAASTGLLYMASFLRRNGIEAYCQWNDFHLEKNSIKKGIEALLLKFQPRLVGVSMKWFPHIARVLEICKIVREYDSSIKVVVGGNTASYFYEDIINHECVDYVILGDGEVPLLQLCSGQENENIPNCVYKQGNRIHKNSIDYVQDDTNSSDIFFSHLDRIFVSAADPYLTKKFYINTGKGCSHQCFYCAGCKTMQKRVFNRTRPFLRGVNEVRNDLIEARKYASTFMFDFDLPLYDSFDYYKKIWDGIDLSDHFGEFYFWKLPSLEFLDFVGKTFKYVYFDIDICSLSEAHRLKLTSLGLVKPQPTDEDIFAFFDRCETYDNVEVIINQISGLPYFSDDDIAKSSEIFSKLVNTYSCFRGMDWGRLHAQPGAPVIEMCEKFNMHSYAKNFQDFLYYSELNLNEEPYPDLGTFHYPYIYSHDDDLNSRITTYYLDTSKEIRKSEEIKRNHLKVTYTLTYEEMAAKSDQLAQLLRNRNVKPGTVVGIMVERSVEMLIGILAIIKAGGAYLPLASKYPDKRLEYMLKDSSAALVLTQTDLQGRFEKIDFNGDILDVFAERIYSVDEKKLNAPKDKGISDNAAAQGDLAYLIYTSGSTGKPKGVMIEHRNVIRLVKNTDYIDFAPQDRLLMTGEIVFDITTFEIWGSLLNGLNLYLVHDSEILDARQLSEELKENQITILHLIPQLFNQLAGQCIDMFAGLKYLLVGGDWVQPRYINKLKNRIHGLKILHMYGPSENTTFSTFHLIDKEYETAIPIGKPLGNSTVYIVNESNMIQPPGVFGEICIGGDGVARGYLNQPELTWQKFIKVKVKAKGSGVGFLEKDSPGQSGQKIYRTGDLGRWLEHGNIELLGRVDHQVKIRGHRIELGEIESQLLNHAEIKEAVVSVKEGTGSSGDIYICAYIISDKEVQTLNLRDYLLKNLPDYMVPSFFMQLDHLPVTPNGKIDRQALPLPEAKSAGTYIPPENRIQSKLVEIWSGVLGIDKPVIGIDQNFFELGGHSLKATILTAAIDKATGVKVPIIEIFKTPTIRALSQYIEGGEGIKHTPVEPVEKKEYYRLSSAQTRLYIVSQVDSAGTGYNIPLIVELEGNLDIGKLEEAFKRLVNRHESFRTSFRLIRDEPVQVIHHRVKFEVGYFDFMEHFIQPFDLSRAPLLRVGVVKLGKEKHLLMVDMHHIISDGISGDILVQEFMALYRGQELPRLSLQYKDFSEWQNRQKETEMIKKQEKFWLELFRAEGEILAPDMPTDYPRSAVKSFEGDRVTFEIEPALFADMKKMILETGTTLYILLLAVYNVLMFISTGKEDIVVGSGVAGRRHTDLANIIGMFVNMLAMRNRPAGHKRFNDFLAEVRENTLNAFENQDYQFEELVKALGLKMEAGGNPLFNTAFQLQNIAMSNVIIPGLILKSHPYENKTSHFDLVLYASEIQDKLKMEMSYSVELFQPETIEKFSKRYIDILKQVTANREIELKDIEISHDLLNLKQVAMLEDESDFQF